MIRLISVQGVLINFNASGTAVLFVLQFLWYFAFAELERNVAIVQMP